MATLSEIIRYITVNTGNILSLNDITKKANQNATDELTEAIKITLNEWEENDEHAHNVLISRRHDDTVDKMAVHERSDLKIGIKLFVTSFNEKALNDALSNVLSTLNINAIDNLIISYHYDQEKNERGPEQKFEDLKNIWKAIETFVENQKILQIGLSDIEEPVFRDLHEWATVKPSIIQINLATCCVVPPSLQTFCKDNDIQLLTHSDPSDILPPNAISNIFKEQNLILNWVLRFLVHIKCRGVLATKGYLISLRR